MEGFEDVTAFCLEEGYEFTGKLGTVMEALKNADADDVDAPDDDAATNANGRFKYVFVLSLVEANASNSLAHVHGEVDVNFRSVSLVHVSSEGIELMDMINKVDASSEVVQGGVVDLEIFYL